VNWKTGDPRPENEAPKPTLSVNPRGQNNEKRRSEGGKNGKSQKRTKGLGEEHKREPAHTTQRKKIFKKKNRPKESRHELRPGQARGPVLETFKSFAKNLGGKKKEN